MYKTDLALKEYKISIEVISGLCTGSGDTSYYSSDEYVIEDEKIYLLNFNDILNLREKGILEDSELESVYSDIYKKNSISDKLKEHLKSLKLLTQHDNKTDIHKFGSIKLISKDEISEIKAIMGSTIKGLFRHGFEIYNVESVNYRYRRSKKLNLYGLTTINDKDYSNYYDVKDEKDKKNLVKKFPKGKLLNYRYNIKFNKNQIKSYNDVAEIEDDYAQEYIISNASDIIFRNAIFSDCKESEADFAVEKIYDWNRKSEEEILPQYYEVAQRGSLFVGKISYKDIESKKNNLSTISLMYKDKIPIEIALESLKKFYFKVIELEEEYYTIPKYYNELKEFYEYLRKENEKNNQFVCKLGYSGAISKTLLCYDNINDKDKLLPYTLKYMTQTNLPFGWVKIKLEEIKHEN